MDDPYISMGSEESLFDIHSLWMNPALGWEGGGEGLFDIQSLCRNKAQSGSTTNRTFEEKGQPKRNRTDVRLLTS